MSTQDPIRRVRHQQVLRTPAINGNSRSKESKTMELTDSEQKASESERTSLLNFEPSSKVPVPPVCDYLDKDEENNNTRFEIIRKLTSNFTKLDSTRSTCLDVFETIHRMTFSIFASTRNKASEVYPAYYNLLASCEAIQFDVGYSTGCFLKNDYRNSAKIL